MTEAAMKVDGTKFMWDKGYYSTKTEAEERKADYEGKGFETQIIEEEGKYLIYSRRLITEIVLEGGGTSL